MSSISSINSCIICSSLYFDQKKLIPMTGGCQHYTCSSCALQILTTSQRCPVEECSVKWAKIEEHVGMSQAIQRIYQLEDAIQRIFNTCLEVNQTFFGADASPLVSCSFSNPTAPTLQPESEKDRLLLEEAKHYAHDFCTKDVNTIKDDIRLTSRHMTLLFQYNITKFDQILQHIHDFLMIFDTAEYAFCREKFNDINMGRFYSLIFLAANDFAVNRKHSMAVAFRAYCYLKGILVYGVNGNYINVESALNLLNGQTMSENPSALETFVRGACFQDKELLQRSTERGFKEALCVLGKYYFNKEQFTDALRCFQEARLSGMQAAYLYLADFYKSRATDDYSYEISMLNYEIEKSGITNTIPAFYVQALFEENNIGESESDDGFSEPRLTAQNLFHKIINQGYYPGAFTGLSRVTEDESKSSTYERSYRELSSKNVLYLD